MYTPHTDKITFKTLDESDEVFDMSCACVYYLCAVLCIQDLFWSLDTVCAHSATTGLKHCPSNQRRSNKCAIKQEATSLWPKFVSMQTQSQQHDETNSEQ